MQKMRSHSIASICLLHSRLTFARSCNCRFCLGICVADRACWRLYQVVTTEIDAAFPGVEVVVEHPFAARAAGLVAACAEGKAANYRVYSPGASLVESQYFLPKRLSAWSSCKTITCALHKHTHHHHHHHHHHSYIHSAKVF